MDRAARSAATPPSASSSGFTLIEVIVVTVIIAVIVSATLLSVSIGERGRAQEVSRRLVSLMNNLSAEAILTGVPRGLRWDENTRRVVAVYLQESSWRRDARFGDVRVPGNWSLRMSSGTEEGVDLASLSDAGDDAPPADDDEGAAAESERVAVEPWVRFQPTGLWQPDGILQILIDRETQATFGWTATGRVVIGRRATQDLP